MSTDVGSVGNVDTMRIIPVIDIQNNVVVRGIAGQRQTYRPIKSQLTNSTQPVAIAQAFIEQFGLRTFYIADLDAIAGQQPNRAALEALQTLGVELWIDAGVASLTSVQRYGSAVIGLESLANLAALENALTAVSPSQAIFSLDLYQGRPWTKAADWQALSAIAIAHRAAASGIGRLIVLDVASVGMNQGPGTLELGQQLRDELPRIERIGGGGVRHVEDLHALQQAGFASALVASALHDGRLTAADLTTFKYLPSSL
ncbi:MAG TPA: HisA/HisF-related TIM barrel protein [Pirellulaceae bacterium]|nr:HisA/HisF-related TIM barrel protein [Pirellulaceae bacterium]